MPILEIFFVILAYILGSIPTSLIISKKVFNIDIREYGSGNTGTTNTLRVLGKKWALIVLLVDVTKGFLATSLWIFIDKYQTDSFARMNFMIILGIVAVVGHIFPVFAHFKGGKGVATLLGMAIAIQPIVAFYSILVFSLCLVLTKFVSLSSILSALAFMILILFIFNEEVVLYRIFAILVAITVIITHQKNIQKLVKGTESKFKLNSKNKK